MRVLPAGHQRHLRGQLQGTVGAQLQLAAGAEYEGTQQRLIENVFLGSNSLAIFFCLAFSRSQPSLFEGFALKFDSLIKHFWYSPFGEGNIGSRLYQKSS